MATYTTNYQLHQWEASDNFLRTDFNTDFQKIDAALAGLEAGKAGTSDLTALQSGISAAQSTANGRARALKGTFTGSGSAPRTISIGGTPKILFLRSGNRSGTIMDDGSISPDVTLVSNGFRIEESDYWASTSGLTVHYVAIV